MESDVSKILENICEGITGVWSVLWQWISFLVYNDVMIMNDALC